MVSSQAFDDAHRAWNAEPDAGVISTSLFQRSGCAITCPAVPIQRAQQIQVPFACWLRGQEVLLRRIKASAKNVC